MRLFPSTLFGCLGICLLTESLRADTPYRGEVGQKEAVVSDPDVSAAQDSVSSTLSDDSNLAGVSIDKVSQADKLGLIPVSDEEAYGIHSSEFDELSRSAHDGDAQAQTKVAAMLLAGEAVPQDIPQAILWLNKAAQQRNVDAETLLGELHATGVGVAEDPAKAADWYRKAAAQGHPKAHFKLGMMHDSGEGVPQDPAKAYELLAVAVELGYSEAVRPRGVAALKLSEEQLQEVKAKVEREATRLRELSGNQ